MSGLKRVMWKVPSNSAKRLKRGPGATKRKKTGEVSISFLIRKLDGLFSKYVRLNRADKEGIVPCFTCDKPFHYKKLQNGHYISRFYKSVRWNTDNCRPQCMWCNMLKSGDIVNFRERLIKEIGEPSVLELEQARTQLWKADRAELQQLIDFYQVWLDEYGEPTNS